MTVPSKAWDQVNEGLMALGTQVRTSADKMTKGSAAFEKSVTDMFAAIEGGFGLAGKAIRDPKIRKDLSNVADSVRHALLATISSVGEQVRERLPHAPGERSSQSTGRKAAAPKTATRRTASVNKAAPANKAARANKAAPVKKATTAKRAAPANKAAAVKKAAPTRNATVGRSTARKRTAT